MTHAIDLLLLADTSIMNNGFQTNKLAFSAVAQCLALIPGCNNQVLAYFADSASGSLKRDRPQSSCKGWVSQFSQDFLTKTLDLPGPELPPLGDETQQDSDANGEET